MITGQLILMDKGIAPVTRVGPHRLVMVVGIVAMPKADADRFCSDRHLRTVAGFYLGEDVKLMLTDELVPIPDFCRGADASTLLEAPIWRV
jgi:hypothetical protein